MYDFLGVQYHPQRFLFEFARARSELRRKGSEDSSYFVHASNLHKTPPPRPRTMTTISYWVEVVYLVVCYAWFSICCFAVKPKTTVRGTSETLHEYLKRMWVPEYFVTYYLLPLISSVTTCPHESLLGFPASDVIEYKRRTHGAPHHTVSNGVGAVQEKLAKDIECQLSTIVSEVRPCGDQVLVSWRKRGASQGVRELFDKVVLAVAPDIVGQILEPLRYQMSRIPTTVVESIVHTDLNHLEGDKPHREIHTKDGAQLIYLRTSSNDTMRRTESLHVQPCGAIVTTCPFSPIDTSRIIHSAKFTRVLRSPESQRIVNSIFEDTPSSCGDEKLSSLWKNGDNDIWLVGGWCWDGMVLLEGCVVSACRVAHGFGVDVPWQC
ncbi:hypothetical protein K491DRAFT_704920 [Lophiostoma macrostomum CBS 122681]|uniref:Amine oxidase domain-containing protein n=1 Tax=Lophiostoma macrostomum CBS 122681 TaxID=1314788 RepID=A0A6A6T5I5_9PLEO|nr:hypothetical protein K491DRAFT_704920 [Lophiostoma macrostomum CBS 122681]